MNKEKQLGPPRYVIPMEIFSFKTKRKKGGNKHKYKVNIDGTVVKDTSIG